MRVFCGADSGGEGSVDIAYECIAERVGVLQNEMGAGNCGKWRSRGEPAMPKRRHINHFGTARHVR
jgi:hypothetical protein